MAHNLTPAEFQDLENQLEEAFRQIVHSAQEALWENFSLVVKVDPRIRELLSRRLLAEGFNEITFEGVSGKVWLGGNPYFPAVLDEETTQTYVDEIWAAYYMNGAQSGGRVRKINLLRPLPANAQNAVIRKLKADGWSYVSFGRDDNDLNKTFIHLEA